jgi:hypothetical protein
MSGHHHIQGPILDTTQIGLQIQMTEVRREGMEAIDAPAEAHALPGLAAVNGDLGPDDEAEGDVVADDGDVSGSGEPGAGDVVLTEEVEPTARGPRQLSLDDLLGSRPPVVLLRVDCVKGEVKVRPCAAPSFPPAALALDLLTRFVGQRFQDGRPKLTDEEWNELIGGEAAPLGKRLTLLLRLAVKPGEKVSLGEGTGAAFTPNDIGLERFANKFAALPDGTPFSIRLLLLDERGKKKSGGDGGFFSRFPKALTYLALQRALQRECVKEEAVSDYEFGRSLRDALEELLGTDLPMPGEEDIQRLREGLKRNGLGHRFRNRAERQRQYDSRPSSPLTLPSPLSEGGEGRVRGADESEEFAG